ncbi:MAG: presenilin family intramembrane aspartyl protease [Patescibacteria group bacterium]|nr:presenilin family intramembrane aspartyl protease [Patescibacteria group bacterium]
MKQLRPFNINILLFTVVCFLITQGLGILGAQRAYQFAGSQMTEIAQRSGFEFWQMIIIFFVGTLIFLSFLKMSRGKIFFDILFSFAVFFGVWLIVEVFLPKDVAILIAATVIFVRYFYPTPFTQNLAIILGIAGLSVGIGLVLSVKEVLIILVLLSFYDIIAVFVTKHMVKMFRGLLERGVIMALMIPFDVKDLFLKFKKIKPKDKFMFLGTGDLALPTVFIVAILPYGWLPTIGAVIGSLVGLYITQTIFLTGRKRPIPALPPIATGTILGYLVGMVI